MALDEVGHGYALVHMNYTVHCYIWVLLTAFLLKKVLKGTEKNIHIK